MVIRSICIWIAVSIIWFFVMGLTFGFSNRHSNRIAEIEKEISGVKSDIRLDRSFKAVLLKQRNELSRKIENSKLGNGVLKDK